MEGVETFTKEKAEAMLNKLETASSQPRNTHIKLLFKDIISLCNQAKEVLKRDPTNIPLQAPITVCGDIHGQFYDFLQYFKTHTVLNNKKYLFLGDYVDRGENSIEVISYLFALKIRYPNNVWLLRGNHETRDISTYYGFKKECDTQYGEQGSAIWEAFNEAFLYLPLTAVISERIFCVHGGLSQDLSSIEDIEAISRPLTVPESGLVCDLLWADPDPEHYGFFESERGVSYTFGKDVADEFLNNHDYDLICRAHQQVENGYDFPFYPDNSVLTVFTAPDYDHSGNKGAVLDINEELMCSFTYLEPPLQD